MEAGIDDNEEVESWLKYSNTADQAVSYAFESRSSAIGMSLDASIVLFTVLVHFLADGDINILVV